MVFSSRQCHRRVLEERMDGDRARGPHDDSAAALGRIIVRAAWRPGHPGVGRPSAYYGVTACW